MADTMKNRIEEILRVVGPLSFEPDQLKSKYIRERDIRSGGEGNAQYAAIKGALANFEKDPWVPPLTRDPIIDHTEIIIAGGGFGGLTVGARLNEAGFSDIRIIEEGGDFGGTWYWNRYPGAMCDIEAHIYIPLLEELQYAPKHRYSYATEMFEISQNIGRKYDLYRKACFQTSITSARWLDQEQRWLIETNRGDRMTANYIFLACGRQSLPKLPGIPGLDSFKGHAFHSSRWDYAYTGGNSDGDLTGLADKRVAVIGTGATAVQIVPAIAKYVKELLVFQRTPSSISSRDNKETDASHVDMSMEGWHRARRYNFQRSMAGIAQESDDIGDGWTKHTAAITPPKPHELAAKLGREPTKDELKLVAEVYDYGVMNGIRARVDEIVKDPETAESLKPWYRWLCKRPCFHDEYLPTFNRPHVKLINTLGRGVERVTEHGLVAGGVEYPADCLIFATGFEAGISFTRLVGFELYGREGISLSEHWKDGVRTLHGMTTDKFPNCIIVGGNQQSAPAFNTGHLLDELAHHFAYIMKTAKQRNISSFEPSAAAIDDYVSLIKSSPTGDVLVEFYLDCTPGYYNAEGKAKRPEDIFFGARYGDGAIAFYRMLDNWRESDNLGGFSLKEKVKS